MLQFNKLLSGIILTSVLSVVIAQPLLARIGNSSQGETPGSDSIIAQTLITEERLGNPSDTDPLIGTWESLDKTLQPYEFAFLPAKRTEKAVLEIVYNYLSGKLIKQATYQVSSPKSGEKYRKIDIQLEGGKTIKTIFEIIMNKNGDRILSMELKGLQNEPRPTQITPTRERKFIQRNFDF